MRFALHHYEMDYPTDEQNEELNFLEAVAGLILEPGQTTEDLLTRERPPFWFTLFFSLFLTIFTPVVAQMYKYGITLYNAHAVYSIVIVVLITGVVFLMLEGLFLQLLGIDFNFRQLLACFAYSITPVTLALWLVYLFNYLANGRLTLITLLVTGFGSGDDQFLKIVPVASLVAQLMMLVVFYHSVRVLGQLGGITAFLITVLSLIPFYGSLLISLLVADIVRPGTIGIFMQVLASPQILTVFQ